MNTMILFWAGGSVAYCLGFWYLARRLRAWLALLICTCLLIPLSPVISIHEGGVAMGTAGYLIIAYWDYIKDGDISSFAVQILFAWVGGNILVLATRVIWYFLPKPKPTSPSDG